MHEQRRANASVAASDTDARDARPETPVLEHSRVCAGKRKGLCPYEHLGLMLPSYDFWDLLQPELASAFASAKAKAKSQALAA